MHLSFLASLIWVIFLFTVHLPVDHPRLRCCANMDCREILIIPSSFNLLMMADTCSFNTITLLLVSTLILGMAMKFANSTWYNIKLIGAYMRPSKKLACSSVLQCTRQEELDKSEFITLERFYSSTRSKIIKHSWVGMFVHASSSLASVNLP